MSYESYTLEEVKKGRELKVLLMSHNAYWTSLQVIEHHHKNFHVYVTGGGTSYLRIYPNYENDYDLIILYSSKEFNPDDLKYMELLAEQFSSQNNKRVTIGYRYFINHSRQEIIYSIKDGEYNKEIKDVDELDHVIALVDSTLKLSDELELQKKKSLKNN